LLGIDPYICVNSGIGDAQSAAAWVEYVNGSAKTPMGKLRAANGHKTPYNVKWWGIGNEMYGQWQLGHMYIDHYVLKHNMFARAMREVDPTIELIASGATPFETGTTVRHHRPPLPAKLPFEYGSPQDWSGRLLANCADSIDYLAEHLYPMMDSAFDANSQSFVPVRDTLINRVRRITNRVQCAVEAWEEYLRRMPNLKDTNIKIAIDEWTSGGRNFSGSLVVAEVLNEMSRHSDIIKMGAYTAFSGCLAYDGADSTYSTIGLVFMLYRKHFGTIPVEVSGNSPQHEVQGTIGVDKPAVSSGSDTYPLDVAAALSSDRKVLTVAVVNPTESVQKINTAFRGVKLNQRCKKWEIVPGDINARNIAGQNPNVGIAESASNEVSGVLEVPPISITVYEFEIR
jgi:alpha-N-arabinofuranosidase